MTSISATLTSLTGMQAAQQQVFASASNIANQFSTTSTKPDGSVENKPYQPIQSVNVSQEQGVSSVFQPVSPASFSAFLPDNAAANEEGIVQMPNVDTANETVNMLEAKNAFQANLAVLKANDEMNKDLLDTFA